MAKHNCAICGAEVGLISGQKLADGNYICKKVCGKKCLKTFDKVAATLQYVNDHIAQVELGTKIFEEIIVPLKKTKVKEEKLRQVYGIKEYTVYVSPSTGLISFEENRYKILFFGKTTVACVYRLADLYGYDYETEIRNNSEGKPEILHYCRFVFRNTVGMYNFRVQLGSKSDFDILETQFDTLFGIQKTLRNSLNNAKRQMQAIKAGFGAVKAAIKGEEDVADKTVEAFDAMDADRYGDRTEWIAKADAALAKYK